MFIFAFCLCLSVCIECCLQWVRTSLRRGEGWMGRVLLIPPTPDALRTRSNGGMLWSERGKKRTPPGWVRRRTQSYRNGRLGKTDLCSGFLCSGFGRSGSYVWGSYVQGSTPNVRIQTFGVFGRWGFLCSGFNPERPNMKTPNVRF